MRIVNCSVCDSGQQRFFLEEDGFKVVECSECGHLYTSPLFDGEVYVGTYQDSGNWIKPSHFNISLDSNHKFSVYALELKGVLGGGGRVLEVGCSKGFLLKLLQQCGFDCYGVEPGRDADIASGLLGKDRITRGFYDHILPFAADAVVMMEVLEHIPEPHKVVELIFRQLRPGGYFMGSIPNGEFTRMKVWPRRIFGLRTLVVPLTLDAGNHINYFSAGGIQYMLERTGFKFLWTRNSPLEFNYISNRFRRWSSGFGGLEPTWLKS